MTGFGGTSRWKSVIDRRAATQLFLANRVLSAAEALDFGLVDRVAESHDDVLARVEAMDLRMVKELTVVASPRAQHHRHRQSRHERE